MKNKKIARKCLQNFCSETTIHGLNYIGAPKLHFFERLFWFFIVIAAIFGVYQLTMTSLNRYFENPTVVSLQKDFRNWMNPFPSVTGCFINKMNGEKAAKYIFDKWGIKEDDEKFKYYLEFIRAVTNISYENMRDFERYKNDNTLKNINLLDLAIKVHPKLEGTLVVFDAKRKSYWNVVITERGICFSVNIKFAKILGIRLIDYNTTGVESPGNLRCHYLNGLCYGRFDSDPTLPVQYYVHSYLDVVHSTSDPPIVVHESEELEINYRIQETISAPALRNLSPAQRRCRFPEEPISKDLNVYSTTLCYNLCRYRLALKLCECKPFFYPFLSGKICDVKGMLCLAKHKEKFLLPPSEIDCFCPPTCDLVAYLPQVPKITKWEYGYFDQRITFRWGLIPPTTKYVRDILFGIDSLVASSGGTVSLFLGMSFIGLIELLYLILENAFYGVMIKKSPKYYNKPK